MAYRSTSSTSIYVQWSHSIPQELVNGILIGYRVAWDEDHFSSGHPDDSQGYADVGLDTSIYNVTSLYEYWLYNIRVAGRTSVGPGTYTTVTVMTNDSSKCLMSNFLKTRVHVKAVLRLLNTAFLPISQSRFKRH